MSSFPVACNAVHARRYANARSLRQVSEPTGVVSKSESKRSSSPTTHYHHHRSAESPSRVSRGHATFANHPHMRSLTQHMGHLGELAKNALPCKESPSLIWRSLSVDTLFRNILPIDNKSTVPKKNLDKQDLVLSLKSVSDSGFGSPTFSSVALGSPTEKKGGLDPNSNHFFKEQTESMSKVIDALKTLAAQQTQNSN